jgi:FkbM family methyltransferase
VTGIRPEAGSDLPELNRGCGLYLASREAERGHPLHPNLGFMHHANQKMTIRSLGGRLLKKFPRADGLFRRAVWSKLDFPEAEMKVVNSLPNDSMDIAIDVGAARGAYSWILNRKSRQVFAFEPGDQHSRYLESVIRGSKIKLIKAAVGGSCGAAHMYTPGSSSDSPYLATLSETNPVVGQADTRIRVVQQVTLDSFFLDTLDAGRTIDFIKIDVEGHELEVFKGAGGLITRHHPLILCEIEQRHNPDCGKVFQLLRSYGYKSHILQGQDLVEFEGTAVDRLQTETPGNRYINNFVFQHARSRIKLAR